MDIIDPRYQGLFNQTGLPVLAGIAFLLAETYLPKGRKFFSVLLIVAQLLLIFCIGYAAIEPLLFFVPLFAGVGISIAIAFGRSKTPPLLYGVAWFFFSLFILSWIFLKYVGAFPPSAAFSAAYPQITATRSALLTFSRVGLSYIGFKLIHFFVDYRQNAIKNFSLFEFLSWLFFLPSLVAGPMQRFQEWQEQRSRARLTIEHLGEGTKRIIIGLLYKTVVADSIHHSTLATMTSGALATDTAFDIFTAAMAYTVYLYFDFAGYSSMAVGLGHFWGIVLPENFNAPFKARNLAEFWNRWHITLSELLRDYLYYPLSITLKRKDFFKKNPTLGAALPPIITFLFAGVWHGATLGFVIFGLLHGLGLAYVTIVGRGKKKGRFGTWWKSSKIAYLCSVSINFCYVSFTFIFFCLSGEKLSILWSRLVGQAF